MIFDVSAEWKKRAFITPEKYQQMYKASLANPEKFWGEQAERLDWFEKWNKVKDVSFNSPVKIGWYLGGKLNVSYNCIDRHLKTRANQTAIIWESDDPKKQSQNITYQKLHDEVCKLANALKSLKVKRGDRV